MKKYYFLYKSFLYFSLFLISLLSAQASLIGPSEEALISSQGQTWLECIDDLCQESYQNQKAPMPRAWPFMNEYSTIFDEKILPLLKEIDHLYIALCKEQARLYDEINFDPFVFKLSVFAPEQNPYYIYGHTFLINPEVHRTAYDSANALTAITLKDFSTISLKQITQRILFELERAPPSIRSYFKTRYFLSIDEFNFDQLYSFLDLLDEIDDTRRASRGANLPPSSTSKNILKDLLIINHPISRRVALSAEKYRPTCTFLDSEDSNKTYYDFTNPTFIQNLKGKFIDQYAYSLAAEHFDLNVLQERAKNVYAIIKNLLSQKEEDGFNQFFNTMRFKIFPSIQHELYLLKNLYLAPLKEIAKKLENKEYTPELSGNLNHFYYSLTKFSETADDYSFFSNSIYIKEVRLELKQSDIIAHELGHSIWRFFTKKDNQERYPDFFSKIKKVSACLNKIHASLNDLRPLSQKLIPFALEFETLYTGEDFADLIASYYLKHTSEKITWYCSPEKNFSKHYFPHPSFISENKDDEHASTFFRLFMSHLNQEKELPKSCKERLEKENISEGLLTPCLSILEG